MLNTEELKMIIDGEPSTKEILIVKNSIKSIISNSKQNPVEFRRKVVALSDTKLVINYEIINNDITCFHYQKQLDISLSITELLDSVKQTDATFVSKFIVSLVTYQSLGRKDMKDLEIYRRKHGKLY